MDQPTSPLNDRISERLADAGYVIHMSSGAVRDIPERLRPREEMDRLGPEHVSDEVLLAVILRSGVRGMNVVDLARGLLKRYGTFTEMARAEIEELAAIKGIGRVKAQVLKAAMEIGRKLAAEGVPERHRVRAPEDAARLVRGWVKTLDAEVFWALLLDAKNCLKCKPIEVTRGLLDASLVHPREVFRAGVRMGAAAVVLVHNHPSGDPSPSAEDLRVTKQLVSAGKIVDIKVLDHVIVGKGDGDGARDFLSLREEGIVDFA